MWWNASLNITEPAELKDPLPAPHKRLDNPPLKLNEWLLNDLNRHDLQLASMQNCWLSFSTLIWLPAAPPIVWPAKFIAVPAGNWNCNCGCICCGCCCNCCCCCCCCCCVWCCCCCVWCCRCCCGNWYDCCACGLWVRVAMLGRAWWLGVVLVVKASCWLVLMAATGLGWAVLCCVTVVVFSNKDSRIQYIFQFHYLSVGLLLSNYGFFFFFPTQLFKNSVLYLPVSLPLCWTNYSQIMDLDFISPNRYKETSWLWKLRQPEKLFHQSQKILGLSSALLFLFRQIFKNSIYLPVSLSLCWTITLQIIDFYFILPSHLEGFQTVEISLL